MQSPIVCRHAQDAPIEFSILVSWCMRTGQSETVKCYDTEMREESPRPWSGTTIGLCTPRHPAASNVAARCLTMMHATAAYRPSKTLAQDRSESSPAPNCRIIGRLRMPLKDQVCKLSSTADHQKQQLFRMISPGLARTTTTKHTMTV